MRKRIAVVVVLLAIAWATLRPMPETGVPIPACFLCGPRAVADALLNVVLFVPLGAVLAGWAGVLPAVALGAVLSTGIEVAQQFIPGRDAAPSDVLFNTVGTALGLGLVRMRGRWLAPGPALGDGLAAAWGVMVLLAIFLTGWLLEPVVASPPYSVLWTPHIGGMEDYRGRVLDAAIGNAPLRQGPAASAGRWGPMLARGVPIAVVAELGAPPRRLAPLLAIYHDLSAAELMLGVRGEDLVLHRQVRAHRWHLDVPELKARGVLSSAQPGDTVLLATVRTPAGQCFVVRRQSHCGIGFDAGDGWRLLYGGNSFSPASGQALNALWLGLLVLPIGFWSRHRSGLFMLAVVAWYAWVRVVADTILLPIGWVEAGGLAAGFAAGVLLSRVARRPASPTLPATAAP